MIRRWLLLLSALAVLLLNYENIIIDDSKLNCGIVLFSHDNIYWGYLDLRNGYKSNEEYIHIYIGEDPSNDILALDMGGFNGLGFFSRSKKCWIIDPQYSGEYYTEFSYGWALVMKINNEDEDDYDIFLIDKENNKMILGDDLVPLNNFYYERCRVYSKETGFQGFIDPFGSVVIPIIYEDAWDFDKNGFARVWLQNGDVEYIDTIGALVTTNKDE